jgi:hypothetical protein
MKVKALIELLKLQHPEETVAILDSSNFPRAGVIRPLEPTDLKSVLLAVLLEPDGNWHWLWGDHPDGCIGPLPALMIGNR